MHPLFPLKANCKNSEVKLKAKVNKVEAKNVPTRGEGETTRGTTPTQCKFTIKIFPWQNEFWLKGTQLEAKVQEQEKIRTFLLLQANELATLSDGGSKLFSNKRQTAIQSNGKSGIPRTSQELRSTDPSLPSGMKRIDPDGQGSGENPIYYSDLGCYI